MRIRTALCPLLLLLHASCASIDHGHRATTTKYVIATDHVYGFMASSGGVEDEPAIAGIGIFHVVEESLGSVTLNFQAEKDVYLGSCRMRAGESYKITITLNTTGGATATIVNKEDSRDTCTTTDVSVSRVRAPGGTTIIHHTQSPTEPGVTIHVHSGATGYTFVLFTAA